MYNIETKPDENYLILTLKGNIPYDSFITLSEELFQKATTLKPGFGVVTDMREWEASDDSTKSAIAQVMKKMVELGMKNVARVIKNATQEMLQSFQKANVEAGYFTRYFITIEDAEKYIIEAIKPKTSE